MDGAELDGVVSLLEGPVAIAFVRGDAAAAAKALRDFSRNNPALVVKGGLLGGKVLAPTAIEALAELPSRDVLLAQIAGAFQAPLVKAAGLFQALPRNLAYGVKALIDQRVAGGEARAGGGAADRGGIRGGVVGGDAGRGRGPDRRAGARGRGLRREPGGAGGVGPTLRRAHIIRVRVRVRVRQQERYRWQPPKSCSRRSRA